MSRKSYMWLKTCCSWGDRVVVPKSLQKEMLALLHESHVGIEMTKARATNALYWPGMSDDIQKTVANCSICLHHRNTQPKEPPNAHPVPEIAWQKVGADIFTYQAEDYLLVVDYYSKYPEVVPIADKTAATVIMAIKIIIARHDVPEYLVTDNMPFDSHEFPNSLRPGE